MEHHKVGVGTRRGVKKGKEAEVTMTNYFPYDLDLFILGNQLRFEKLQKYLYKLC